MTEMHSSGTPATAIEPATTGGREPLSFAAGVAVGVLIAAIGAQLWLAQHLEPLAQREAEMQAEIRSLSRLAQSPLWAWGVPAAFAAALAGVGALRVRAAIVYAAVAALAVLALVLTYVWATSPLTELAGGLSD
jgi:hypothetical protein